MAYIFNAIQILHDKRVEKGIIILQGARAWWQSNTVFCTRTIHKTVVSFGNVTHTHSYPHILILDS